MYKFLTILYLFLISSCYEYTPPYKLTEIQYTDNFVNTFGRVSETHSWDYYSEYAEIDNTRAMFTPLILDTIQSEDVELYSDVWKQYLPEKKNNSTVGQSKFQLVSNGEFFIDCVWYYSTNPTTKGRDFECGILFNGWKYPLFRTYEYDVRNKGGINPGFAKLIDLGYNNVFKFYISYKNNSDIYLNSDEYAKLLFSKVVGDKEIIIIGFEDTPFYKNSDKDFNDIILYLIGNPNLPVLESKRFFCEDLGDASNSDFDYNDIVFDVHPVGDSTQVTIRALGGTLPIKLFIDGIEIGNGDLHEVLSTNHIQANVDYGLSFEPYTETIPLIINDLSSFSNVWATVGPNYSTLVPYRINTLGPAIIAVPAKTKWMKEFVNIKKGYPNFFESGWYNNVIDRYTVDK